MNNPRESLEEFFRLNKNESIKTISSLFSGIIIFFDTCVRYIRAGYF